MKQVKARRGKILLVGGPAIIHTGASRYVANLIANGFIHVIFAGNALAVHDLEQATLGTSLGMDLKSGSLVKDGHHNHLHTINRIRYYGSIQRAIDAHFIQKGIMYEAVKQRIPFVLAGSIRDDGPVPEVIADSQLAQQRMREEVHKGIDLCLMVATTLHSIATGNLLPSSVKKVVVSTDPSSVIKLVDRGTTGSINMVTDCEFFFCELARNLL
jgi:lysine-ketoglutarate reductase/saccharopine dehydrogenase-like protein (TIGR00300 family)